MRADQLQAGDELFTSKGGWLRIKGGTWTSRRQATYNLEVEGFHTFFVGDTGAWVHNAGTCGVPNQLHHYATNKSKTYTPEMERIARRFGLDLDGDWNKELLRHQGRHPNLYHEFVLEGMRLASGEAGGSVNRFLELFELYVKSVIRKNPDLLRVAGWR